MKALIYFVMLLFLASPLSSAANNKRIDPEKKKTVVLTHDVSPFCIAIAQDDFDMVVRLIDLGTDLNETSRGMTPLMYAARYDRAVILELLIENGADLSKKDKRTGLTARDYAEQFNATEVLKVLNSV
ncbi:ankyrin repeat domain-containing protein [Robertkochia aurantiaca]|uniref:ankyrin repeat domain-containing protein n=1 Tax=Robertkochia aurantiaca TaxID=2873700 RepID=UPI001CC93CB6|nr:ankyrin repeat domain-containing protein [Robertkochia sp. 3YJGBD-33]